MNRRNPPDQVRSHESNPFVKQNALVLNHGPSSCPANRCVPLLHALQTYIPFRQVQECNVTESLPETSFIPDLVILRLSLSGSAQKLIDSCKTIWSCAAILALFCLGSNDPIDILPSDFDVVDDFVSCPFRPGELTLRVKRLLQLKSAVKML